MQQVALYFSSQNHKCISKSLFLSKISRYLCGGRSCVLVSANQLLSKPTLTPNEKITTAEVAAEVCNPTGPEAFPFGDVRLGAKYARGRSASRLYRGGVQQGMFRASTLD
jgi:hypothetical protein